MTEHMTLNVGPFTIVIDVSNRRGFDQADAMSVVCDLPIGPMMVETMLLAPSADVFYFVPQNDRGVLAWRYFE